MFSTLDVHRTQPRSGDTPTACANACRGFLDAALPRLPHVCIASLSTTDGRALAFAIGRGAADPQRIGAMASSSLALAESFARETLRSTCNYSLVATAHGVIVTVRVPSTRRLHVLTIAADDSEMLAIALRNAIDLADGLAAILDQAQT